MKIVVVYDSPNGNTEQIARAIAKAFDAQNTIEVLKASEANFQNLTGSGLVIVGSPTYGGRPTPAMLEFLDNIPETALKGINVAAFDTRLTSKLVVLFGFAAGKIAESLKRKGGVPIVNPEGFFVKGTKGPLKEGELERAATWAKGIVESQKTRAVAK